MIALPLLACALLGGGDTRADAPAASTAFTGATIVNSSGAPPIADGVVVVTGERIAAVGPRDKVAIPAGATLVDLKGKWIIPGLIDAHVHFFQSGGLYTRPDVIDLRDLRPYAEEIAFIKKRLPFARYLACGVTAVADVGGPMWNFEVRELANKAVHAPRVAVAGPLVSTWQPPKLKVDDPPIIEVHSGDEARALVKRLVKREPDLVKIWFIHRRGDDVKAQGELVRAAVEESHAAAVRVAVHATQLEVARTAVEAGAEVLVHSVDDKAVDDDFLRLLKEKDVVYTTTIVVNEGYAEVFGQCVELNDVETRCGDPLVIATFADVAKLDPKRAPPKRPHPPTNPVVLANLKRVQAAGICVAAGTDAGNIGTLHGPSLHREFELMRDAGLTPAEILRAATFGGARVMGREKELGTLEPGKLADLVILDADPLADVVNLRKIHRVVKGGVVLDPEALLTEANGQSR